MLESEIKKLIVAVDANTAALLNGTAPAAATADTLKPAAQAKPVAEPPIPAAAPAAAAPAVEVSKKVLTDTFIKLAQDKGREIAAGILAEFGVTKLPELKDETQWPAFHAKVVAALGAA